MITFKDVAHFHDFLAEELRSSAQFSKNLADHLLTEERRIMGDLHSVGVLSIQDAVSLRDLPHYPLNFMNLPPKFVEIYVSSLMLFMDACSALSRYSFTSMGRAADIQAASI